MLPGRDGSDRGAKTVRHLWKVGGVKADYDGEGWDPEVAAWQREGQTRGILVGAEVILDQSGAETAFRVSEQQRTS